MVGGQCRGDRVRGEHRHPPECHGEADLGELAPDETATRDAVRDVERPDQSDHDRERCERSGDEAPASDDEEPDPQHGHGGGGRVRDRAATLLARVDRQPHPHGVDPQPDHDDPPQTVGFHRRGQHRHGRSEDCGQGGGLVVDHTETGQCADKAEEVGDADHDPANSIGRQGLREGDGAVPDRDTSGVVGHRQTFLPVFPGVILWRAKYLAD